MVVKRWITHPEVVLVSPVEFETCPGWGPSVDRCWRSTPIILKTLGVDWFDQSANWPAKVRNVSRLGSQTKSLFPILCLRATPIYQFTNRTLFTLTANFRLLDETEGRPNHGRRTTAGGVHRPLTAASFGQYSRNVRLNSPSGAGSQLRSLLPPGASCRIQRSSEPSGLRSRVSRSPIA